MEGPEHDWQRIPDPAAAVAENSIIKVELAGRSLCLALHGGRWYAFAWKCPHASGLLSQGRLSVAGEVICPVHGYRFKLASGYNSSGEGFRLRVYSVQAREDGLYVALPRLGDIGLP